MDNQNIGRFLLELRKEKGLTQGEIASTFNVTHQSVSKWEKGDSLPDIHLLKEIASYYNLTIEEILNGERDEHIKSKPSRKLQTVLKFDMIYIVILIGILLSLGLFYFNEEVYLNPNDIFSGFGDMNPFGVDEYVTVNIRGYQLMFSGTSMTLYLITIWGLFLSVIVLFVFKVLNIYSILKFNKEFLFTEFNHKLSIILIFEVLVLACYLMIAVGVIFSSTISLGFGYFMGIILAIIIFGLNRFKLKETK